MEVNATVGDPNANSYADSDFADQYFDSRLDSSAWVDGDDDDLKGNSLIHATRILDSVYDWNGWKHTEEQALKWPRDGALNWDQAFGPNSMFDFDNSLTAYFPNNMVPKEVKNAVCELAIWLLQQGKYTAEINPLKQARVGPLRVDFDPNVANYGIPNTVIEMLRHMGNYRGMSSGGSVQSAELVRT